MAAVADAAGVSVSTVSHVLNHTRPVSEALRDRVLEAVEACGYSPNAVARSLARSDSSLVGVVMSATSNPAFAPAFAAIDEAARRAGFTVVLADSRDDLRIEAEQVGIMLAHRVAGLILATAAGPGSAHLDRLAASGTPTVLVDRMVDGRFDQVGPDNTEPTACLLRHLAGLGHSRIGFVSGRTGLATSAERLAGYRAGLVSAGLRYDRGLVRSGGSHAGPAREAARRLLGLPDPPTALVSANNDMSLGILQALQDAGRRVPEDLAVVGYDDVEWGDLLRPGLTVMAQQTSTIGHTAMDLLLDRVRRPGTPTVTRRLAPTFVHRGSCGCAPPGPT